MNLPILYIKPGCPWCINVVDFLRRKSIDVETVIVSGNRDAMRGIVTFPGSPERPR